MSAKVIQHPATSPAALWPGDAVIDSTGASIALDMLVELEGPGDDGVSAADLSSLENWPREGRPFRNVVAVYAERAQAIGPEALAGFYAVLTDIVAMVAGGTVPDTCSYERFCGARRVES